MTTKVTIFCDICSTEAPAAWWVQVRVNGHAPREDCFHVCRDCIEKRWPPAAVQPEKSCDEVPPPDLQRAAMLVWWDKLRSKKAP